MSDEAPKLSSELIIAFERCVNYPRDEEGVILFAQELRRASDQTGVAMASIVTKCREVSDRAPEFADMVNIAREISADEERKRDAFAEQQRQWREQYGKPEKFQCDWSLVGCHEVHKARRLMNQRIAAHLGINSVNPNPNRRDLQRVSWHDYFTAKKELGYPLEPAQEKYL